MRSPRKGPGSLLLLACCAAALAAGWAGALLGACGPFNDVAADTFCPFVREIFCLGITTGTSPTTYDPSANVTRLQMAAFLSRSVDSAVRRNSRRAVLHHFWTPKNETVLDFTSVGEGSYYPEFDGLDVWVPSSVTGTVTRVRASDGSLLGTWTGAWSAVSILPALGKILVSGYAAPGELYRIDPSQPAGAVTTVASNLGVGSHQLAFDGARFWTANYGVPGPGSVSIVSPGSAIPWTVTTVTTGFVSLLGAFFDGSHVWVTDYGAGTVLKLDPNGVVLQTVTVGGGPEIPAFDGTNIWVPNSNANSVSVVRSSSGAVLATLTGNGLSGPTQAAFDGERILVTNRIGDSVSLWKAADLTGIRTSSTGAATSPIGACSDGIHFFITLDSNKLARF